MLGISTKEMSHGEWLNHRKKGIGGSDAAAICGLSRYKSAVEVWLDKTGQIPPIEQTEKMYWGNRLEEVVAQEFETRNNKRVRRNNHILAHSEHPFIIGNIDRQVVGEKSGLECKTSSRFFSDQWTDTEFPQEYFLQCQHYMAVTGFQKFYLAVLLNGCEYRQYEINRDEELIHSLVKIEADFWKLVEDGICPEPDGSRAATEIISRMHPEAKILEQIILPDDTEELIQQFREAEEYEKLYGTKKDEAANRIKKLLGDYESGRTHNYAVNWKNVFSKRLDSKKLKADRPEIYEEYSSESISRRFAIKEVA